MVRKWTKKTSKKAARRRAKRVWRRRNPKAQGFLSFARKASAIQLYANTGVAGVMTYNDPTGTCLNIGTATLVPGSPDHYDVPFSLAFQLNQMMNSTDITNLFDQYRIDSAKVELHANFNLDGSAPGQFARSYLIPWVEYIQDYDDGTLPTISGMREKMGCRTKYFSADRPKITMGVRPRFAASVYKTALSSAYALGSRNTWLNCDSPDVPHYSIKGILHNVALQGSGTGPLFNLDLTLYGKAKGLQ